MNSDGCYQKRDLWFLAHRNRKAMERDGGLFAGPVEADETFIGGLEKNRHEHKKLRVGTGASGKAIVFGAKNRATGRIADKVLEDRTNPILNAAVAEVTEPGALVYTDEWRGYLHLERAGFHHESANHSWDRGVAKWVDGMAHTNGLESVWAILKRDYHGTYHQMSFEHLDRYIAEFQCRHNERPRDTIDQMADLVRHIEGRVLPYQQLIAEGPHARDRMAARLEVPKPLRI